MSISLDGTWRLGGRDGMRSVSAAPLAPDGDDTLSTILRIGNLVPR